MASHMNLFLALGKELASSGHRVTFFGMTDNERKIREAGFDFDSTEPDHVPAGTLGRMLHQMSELGSFAALRLHGKFDELRYEGILGKGPAAIERAGVEALIVDQAEPCSGSLAERAGLPWVSVANGLAMNSEPAVPPIFTSWSYSESPLAIARNRMVYQGMRFATRSIEKLINRYRVRWGLKPFTRMDDSFSPFAQISQQVREFDFPRRDLPACFHYVGPIRGALKMRTEFPWERLDGRPLIYASLGTFVNRQPHLYRAIATACAGLKVQLVVSLGGAARVDGFSDLPGAPIVVEFAPQNELIARASLTITHGGLNTALESLALGVPLVAIPIAFDQPGVAARIRWTGTGDFVPLRHAEPARLKSTIERVLSDGRYRDAAHHIARGIAQTRGVQRAKEIIEEVMRANQGGCA
jgi:zeaxanthin glucosyltransferase